MHPCFQEQSRIGLPIIMKISKALWMCKMKEIYDIFLSLDLFHTTSIQWRPHECDSIVIAEVITGYSHV